MLQSYLGETAALLASVCFSIGPTLNTLAGRQVDVRIINRTRLLIAAFLLFIPHLLITGKLIPPEAPLERWFWLGLSGILSLVIGDTLLFYAFQHVGTRLTMLILSIRPVISAILAWFILGETLTIMQVLGISITISGVVWVVSEQSVGALKLREDGVQRKGFYLAAGAALLHAMGVIAEKKGVVGDFPTISGHLIRMLVAMLFILAVMVMERRTRTTITTLRENRMAFRFILLGALVGPFTGMWLSLYAVQNLSVGIATALTSLPPILLLPIGYFVFKERVGIRAVAGSAMAVIGVGIIFLL